MKVRILNKSLSISPLVVLLYLLLMALLCRLGFWQLSRSEQKKQLIEQQQVALSEPGLPLNHWVNIDPEVLRYRKVYLKGHFDAAHQFLIDNQIMDGKTGYFVMTPFWIAGQSRAVLINRGWLPASADRQQLPDVTISADVDRVQGRINLFPAVGWKLKGAEIPTETWPAVVQVVDAAVLADKLGYALLDFQIELDADVEPGYRREWLVPMPIPPEKHVAYAVQWFGLALTLTTLLIWTSLRKNQ